MEASEDPSNTTSASEKEIIPAPEFPTFEPADAQKHADLARQLLEVANQQERLFLFVYKSELEKDADYQHLLPPGTNLKNPRKQFESRLILRAQEAARQRLTVLAAIRDLQKFLFASYRGTFMSEKKIEALRTTARTRKQREPMDSTRRIRQPLTVEKEEMDILQEAVSLTGKKLSDFVRDNALAVCGGNFVLPDKMQHGHRNIHHQVRWSEDEWKLISAKAVEIFGPVKGRGKAGTFLREAVMAAARKVVLAK